MYIMNSGDLKDRDRKVEGCLRSGLFEYKAGEKTETDGGETKKLT